MSWALWDGRWVSRILFVDSDSTRRLCNSSGSSLCRSIGTDANALISVTSRRAGEQSICDETFICSALVVRLKDEHRAWLRSTSTLIFGCDLWTTY